MHSIVDSALLAVLVGLMFEAVRRLGQIEAVTKTDRLANQVAHEQFAETLKRHGVDLLKLKRQFPEMGS